MQQRMRQQLYLDYLNPFILWRKHIWIQQRLWMRLRLQRRLLLIIGKEEAAQCSPFYIQVTISHTARIRYTYFRKKNHIY